MSKRYICTNCHRGLSNRPNLCRHKRYHCLGSKMGQRTDGDKKENDMKLADKLGGMLSHEPRVKRSNTQQNLQKSSIAPNLESRKFGMKRTAESVVKKEQHMSEKEKSALYDHLKSYIPPKKTKTSFLPSTVDGLYDKIGLLIGELKAGNTAVKPEIIAILKKLEEKGVLNMEECDEACAQIQDTESEDGETSSQQSESGSDQSTDSELDDEETSSQESESGVEQSTDSDSEVDDEEFSQLIRNVADNLAQNERKNLLHALLAVKSDERQKIESWLEGDENLENIVSLLKDNEDMLKIKILMKQIDERRRKVGQVLRVLRNITDYGELKKRLDMLKNQEVISDAEYKRLIIANHDLKSYVKAFQGTGIWI